MKTSRKLAAAAASVAIVGALITAARFRASSPVGNSHVPEPAKAVSINRYLGRWYEIARYEQRFERGCTNVTADYALRGDGKLEVLNSCRRPDGTRRSVLGVARPVSASNAKLKVRFFGLFSGDYWVLDHADDYSWSIVGEPSGRYLWILARQPNPASAAVEDLISRAAELGYDTSMLLRTRQSWPGIPTLE